MKKVKFNTLFGQLAAALAGRKTQFHNVENQLARLLERDFTSQSVVDTQWIDGECLLAIRLDGGEVVEHRPNYALGEVVEVEDTDARIRITGIRVERLCNLTRNDFFAEGLDECWMLGVHLYTYPLDNETHFINISYQLAWNNLLYRTLDPTIVVCNPYSVVYQFEKVDSL